MRLAEATKAIQPTKPWPWDRLLRGLWLAILLWPFVLQARAVHGWMTVAYVLLALAALPVFLTASTRQQLLGLGFMGSAVLLAMTVFGVGGSAARGALVAYLTVGLIALGTVGTDEARAARLAARPAQPAAIHPTKSAATHPMKPTEARDRLIAVTLAASLVFGPMAVAGAASVLLGARLPWSVLPGGLALPTGTSSDPTQAQKAYARMAIDQSAETLDTPVLSITGAPAPAYWTMAVYDEFDGQAWTGPTSAGAPATSGGGLLPPNLKGFATQNWTVTVRRLAGGDSPLIYVGTPEAVTGPKAASSSLRVVPDLRALWAPGASSYSLKLSVPEIDQDALAKAGFSSPAGLTKDLAIPTSTSPKVADLARSIAGTATGPWAAAKSIADYLMANETYSTQFAESSGDVVNTFLLESHSGSCDQFSTSLVIMLRELSVPSRWVMGYKVGESGAQTGTAGTQAGSGDAGAGTYVVRASDAHSWAEVYVAPYGWVPIDPTPGGQTSGSSVVVAAGPTGGSGGSVSPDPNGASGGNTPGAGGGAQGSTPTPAQSPRIPEGPLAGAILALAAAGAIAIWHRRSRVRHSAARQRVDGLWRGLVRLAGKTARLAGQPGRAVGQPGRRPAMAAMTPREFLALVPEESLPTVIPAVRLLERAWYGDETLPRGEIDQAEAALRALVGQRT